MTAIGVIHQSGRRVWRGCIDRRQKSSLTAASVIAIQTSRTSVAEDLVAPAERGWSSAPRARSRSVGCAILSESLRPPLADQLVDQFALASIVSERAAQLLGCGAALCGRGVGRVRRPGHGLIVAGGGPASRRSRTRPLVSCCVPSLRALPLDEARELRIRPGGWRSLAPGKESVANRSLACLAAMLQLGVLGGFPQVAREAADVPGGGRVRVAGENTMLRDGELRSFAPGARVLVIGQDVEKLAPGGLGGPLGPGSVDVGRVVIGTGSARVARRAGVGDRPVSRREAGDRVCCVPEVSRTGRRTPTKHIRLRTAR